MTLGLALSSLVLLLGGQSTAPSSADWQRDMQTSACALRQDYGDRAAVTITRTPGDDDVKLDVDVPGQARQKWVEFSGASLTLSDGHTVPVDGYLMDRGRGKVRSLTITVEDPLFIEHFAAAMGMTIQHARFGTIDMPLQSSAVAVQALSRCEDAKLRGWGIDPVALRALRSRPEPLTKVFTWFTGDDYPRLGLAYGLQGDVVARLDVDSQGKVVRCSAVQSSVPRDFRDAVCAAVKRRGRFRPAVDSLGSPTTAPFVTIVRFALQ